MYSDNNDLNNVLKSITNQNKIKINEVKLDEVTSGTILDNTKASELGITLPPLSQDVNLTYSHAELTQDGDLKVTIKATKGNNTKNKDITINVIHINKTKAEKALKDYLESASFDSNNLKITNVNKLNAFGTNNKQINESDATNTLGITFNKQKPANITNITYTSLGLENNKALKIKISGVITYTEENNAKSFNAEKELTLDIADIQQTIEGLNTLLNGITHQNITLTNITIVPQVPSGTEVNVNTDELIFKQHGITLPNNIPNDVKLKYGYPTLIKDGDLTVTIEAEKNGISVKKDITINIIGINKARSEAAFKTKWQELLDNNLKGGDLQFSVLSIPQVTEKEILKGDQKIPKNIWDVYQKDNADNGNKHTITIYFANNALNTNGTLTKKFIVKDKGTEIASKEVNYNVTGIDAFNQLQVLIKAIPDVDFSTDKTKLEAVQSGTTLDKDNNPLGITLPNLPNGVTLSYSHPELTKDGDLTVTIKANNGTAELETTVKVHVTGINEVKHKELQDLVDSISDATITSQNVITEVTSGTLNNDKATKLGITLPNIPKDATLTYSHPELTNDGDLKVTIKATKNGAEATHDVIIHVTGIDEEKRDKLNEDLAKLHIDLNNLTTTRSAPLAAANDVTLPDNYLGIEKSKFDSLQSNITYSHSALNHNGNLIVTLKLSRGGVTISKDVTIAVSGINNGILSAIQQDLQGINQGTLNIDQAKYDASTDWDTFDNNAAINLGFTSTQVTDTFNKINKYIKETVNKDTNNIEQLSLQYKITNSLTEDGTLNIEIKATLTMSDGTPNIQNEHLATLNVNVTGITKHNLNELIKNIQDVNLDKTELVEVKSGTPLNSNNPLGITLPPSIPQGVTLTYSHPPINKDGSINVTINATKGQISSDPKTIEVHVSGIAIAKAKEQLKNDISSQIIQDTNYNYVVNALQISAATNEKLEETNNFGLNLSKVPSDVKLTYSHPSIDQDGDLKVTVIATKKIDNPSKQGEKVDNPSKQDEKVEISSNITYTVKVSGINDFKAVSEILENIKSKSSKDGWSDKPLQNMTDQPLDANSASALGITLPQTINPGIELKFSHGKLDNDGNLQVTIKATKGNATKTEVVNVHITGIDEANEIVNLLNNIQDTSLVTFVAKIERKSGGTSIDGTEAKKLNITLPNIPKDVTLTYSHPEFTNNGNLKVTIKAVKGSGNNTITKTKEVKVDVKGIDEFNKLNTILNSFSNTTANLTYSIDEVKDGEFDAAKALELGIKNFPANLGAIKLTYSHELIDRDKPISLKIHGKVSLTENGKTYEKTIDKNIVVNVKGINAKYKNDIESVLKSITINSNLIVQQSELKEIPAGTILDAAIAKQLGINLPTDLKGVILTYSHPALTNDGNLTIEIKGKKGSQESDKAKSFTTHVTGFNAAKDLRNGLGEIQNPQLHIQVNKESYASVAEGTEFTPQAQKDLNITLSSKFKNYVQSKNVKLTYSHPELTKDGKLLVVVKATGKNGTNDVSIVYNVEVEVKGINDYKDVKAIADKFVDSTAKIQEIQLDKVNDGTILDKNGADKLNIYFPSDLNGTTITYGHPLLDHDGQLSVNIKVVKNNASIDKTINVKITGINDAKDLKSVLDSIVNPGDTKIDQLKIDSVDKQALNGNNVGITLPSDLKGATLTYSHPAFDKDGDLISTVYASKNGITMHREIKTPIKGINAAKIRELLSKETVNTNEVNKLGNKEFLSDILNITKKDNIKHIGPNTFNKDVQGVPINIEKVELDNLITIGANAFKDAANLKELNLPKVNSIGADAFKGTQITKIYAPLVGNANGFIADSAFAGVKNLASTEVTLPAMFMSHSEKDRIFGENNWDKITFHWTNGYKGNITPEIEKLILGMKDTVGGTNDNRFPKNVKGLEKLWLPNLQTIGLNYFRDLAPLNEISIESIKTINENAFKYAHIQKVDLPSVQKIGVGAFEASPLEYLNIPNINIINKENDAGNDSNPEWGPFRGIKNETKTNVVMPLLYNTKDDKDFLFKKGNWDKIHFLWVDKEGWVTNPPSKVDPNTHLDNPQYNYFTRSDLLHWVLHNIKTSTIPTFNAEKIEAKDVKLEANNLLNLILPSRLYNANLSYSYPEFDHDGEMTVTLKAEFLGTTVEKEIKVNVTGINKTKWDNFRKNETIDWNKVTSYNNNDFYKKQSNLKGTDGRLELESDKIKTIADGAFKAIDTNGKEVNFNFETIRLENVYTIGAKAFEGSHIKTLYIPKAGIGTGSIGDGAFKNIKNDQTTNVTMPAIFDNDQDKDRIFGENNWNRITFHWTNGYKGNISQDLENQVLAIGNTVSGQFSGKTGIEKLWLPKLKTMNSEYFRYLASLKEITIENIKSLNDNGFKDARHLVKLSLPNIKTIGVGAFENAPLTYLNIPKATNIKWINSEHGQHQDNWGPFRNIVNEPTTTVIMPIKYNNKLWKDFIFKEGNWDKINFTWVIDDGTTNGKRVKWDKADLERINEPHNVIYTKHMENVKDGLHDTQKIPPRIDTNPKNSIDHQWFIDEFPNQEFLSNELKTFKSNVQTIQEGALNGINNLVINTVDLPNVTTIEKEAFKDRGTITSVKLPNVETIGQDAFQFAKITKLDLPKAKTIFVASFIKSPLKELNIPVLNSFVGLVDDSQWAPFSSIINDPSTTVTMPLKFRENRDKIFGKGHWDKITFTWVLEDGTKKTDVEINREKLQEKTIIDTTELEFSNKTFLNGWTSIKSNSATEVKADSFNAKALNDYWKKLANINITSVDLPNVNTIGANAFKGSLITHLNIPDAGNGTGTIGDNAFSDIVNNQNTKVTMPGIFNTTAEKDRIFGQGNWDKITFTWVNGFKGKNVPLTQKNNIKGFDGTATGERWIIGGNNANIKFEPTEVYLSGNTINDKTFKPNWKVDNSNLETLILPNMTTINEAAFSDHFKLKNLSIPKATSIGNKAFQNTIISEINAPELLNIGAEAFEQLHSPDTTKLSTPKKNTSKIFVPKAETIGDKAFASVINASSTQVTMPLKWNTVADKNRIFGQGNWNKISFSWTDDQGNILTNQDIANKFLDKFDVNYTKDTYRKDIPEVAANTPFDQAKGEEIGIKSIDKNMDITRILKVDGLQLTYSHPVIKENDDYVTHLTVTYNGKKAEKDITITITGINKFIVQNTKDINKALIDNFKHKEFFNTFTNYESSIVETIGNKSFEKVNGLPISFTELNLSKVTSIGNSAFKNNTTLTKIALPKVKIIGESAFEGDSSITALNLPKVTNIGTNAFKDNTKLTSVELPNVNTIGANAFKGASITKLVITQAGNNVGTIGDNAFISIADGANITMPGIFNTDDEKARIFGQDWRNKNLHFNFVLGYKASSSLTDHQIARIENLRGKTGNENHNSDDSLLLDKMTNLKQLYLPDLEVITKGIFIAQSESKDNDTRIPELLKLEIPKVTTVKLQALIGASKIKELIAPRLSAVENNSLRSITDVTRLDLPSLHEIELGGFKSAKLTYLNIPNITDIKLDNDHPEHGAFTSIVNDSKTRVILPIQFNNKYSKDRIFNVGNWDKIDFSWKEKNGNIISGFDADKTRFENVDKTLRQDNNKEISRQWFIEEFPNKSFYTDSLKSFTSKATVIKENTLNKEFIDDNTKGTKLLENLVINGNVKLPNVVTIGNNAFKGHEITALSMPNVTKIGEKAFFDAKITELDLPNVTDIGSGAFNNSPLTKLNIPKFDMYYTDVTPFEHIVNKSSTIVTMPIAFRKSSTKEDIRNALFGVDNWDQITFKWIMRDGSTKTDDQINKEELLKKLKIDTSELEFSNKSFLLTLNSLTSQATEIAANAFNADSFNKYWKSQAANTPVNITRIELPDVKTIGAHAFKGSKITYLKIPKAGNGTGSIGDGAFENIVNVKSTEVWLPAIYREDSKKDRIFGKNNWSNITFHWQNGFKGTVTQKVENKIYSVSDNLQRVQFTDSDEIDRLWLPSVTHIPDSYFRQLKTLKEVSFGDIKTIKDNGFKQARLERLSLPSVVTIGVGAFEFSPLTYLNIPNATDIRWGNGQDGSHLENWGPFRAIENESTTKVIMPIKYNNKLWKDFLFKEGNWDKINFTWVKPDGTHISTTQADLERIKNPHNVIYQSNWQDGVKDNGVLGRHDTQKTPPRIDTNPKNSIDHQWFVDEFPNAEFLSNGLKTFKSNATNIGTDALNKINNLVINTVDLPKVTTIGERGFHDQKTITSVKLPNVETIGHDAFKFAQITQLDLPKVKTIVVGSFLNSPLTELNIPVLENIDMQGADSSQWAPFKTIVNNPSTTVTMPLALRLKRDDLFGPGHWDKITFKWVTDIAHPDQTKNDKDVNKEKLLAISELKNSDTEFSNKLFLKDLTSITSSAIKKIDNNWFNAEALNDYWKKLTTINITEIDLPNVNTIGANAFVGNYITKLNIPNAGNGVGTIGDNAFKDIANNANVTMPEIFNNEKDLKRIFGDDYQTKHINFTWVLGYKSSAALSDAEKTDIMKLKGKTGTEQGLLLKTNDKIIELYLPNLKTLKKAILSTPYAFMLPNLTKLVLPNVTKAPDEGTIWKAEKLTTFIAPKITKIFDNFKMYAAGITKLDLPELKEIGHLIFKFDKITFLNIPKATNITTDSTEKAPFQSIENKSTTTVTMPLKYKKDDKLDYIFGANNWNNISFTWTDDNGNILNDSHITKSFIEKFNNEYTVKIDLDHVEEAKSGTNFDKAKATVIGISSKDPNMTITNMLNVNNVEIKYSHPLINGDGDYTVHVVITRGTTPKAKQDSKKEKDITIHVTGINEYRIKHKENLEKALIDGFAHKEFFAKFSNLQSDKIKTIGDSTFENTQALPLSFTTIDLPNVTSIGNKTFKGNDTITNIKLPKVLTIGNSAFEGDSKTANLDLSHVNTIGNNAFKGATSITTLDLPRAYSIGASAFEGAPITSLKIPNAGNGFNVTIGDNAFSNIINDSNTKVTMPVSFNNDADKDRIFGSGNWSKITFNWTLSYKTSETIDNNKIDNILNLNDKTGNEDNLSLLKDDKLTELYLPKLEKIQKGIFINSTDDNGSFVPNLTKLVVPNVLNIVEHALIGAKALKILEAPKLISVGNNSIRSAEKLVHIDLPEINTINLGAFRDSKITYLNIPKANNIDVSNANNLGWGAFINIVNDKNTMVIMPLKYRLDRDKIFGKGHVDGKDKAELTGDESHWDKITFKWVLKDGTIKTDVEINRETLQEKTTIDTSELEFANKLFLKDWTSITSDKVDTVKANSFKSTKELPIKFTTVNLANVKTIEENAFKDNKDLVTVVLPKVETIGNSAFEGDSKISALDLAKAVTIGDNAFKGNTAITTITLPEVDKIGASAFEGVTKVTSLDLHTVNTIGVNAFKDAPLTSLDISNAGNGVGTIGDHAFESIANGAKVTMPLTFNNDKDLKRIFGDNYNTKNIDFTWVLGYKSSAALSDEKKQIIMSFKGKKGDEGNLALIVPSTDANKNVDVNKRKLTELTELYLPKLEKIQKGIFVNGGDDGSFIPNVTKLVIPKVTKIETRALVGAKALKILEAPKLTFVGDNSIHSSTNITHLDLPEINQIWLAAFRDSKITYLNIPKAINILTDPNHTYGPFINIVNASTTHVTMPVKYNTTDLKNKIFNDNWGKIQFTWTDSNGNAQVINDKNIVETFIARFDDSYNSTIDLHSVAEAKAGASFDKAKADVIGITPNNKPDVINSSNITDMLKIDGLTMTYSHPTIDQDGDYTVHLIIQKGTEKREKDITIHVTGMNKHNVLNATGIQKTLTEGFKVKDFWKTFNDLNTNTITSVGDNTFAKSTKVPVNFTSVNLPNATSIGNGAFKDNTALTTIALPKVTNIADNAFKGNTSLAAIKLDEVTNIGASAFEGNTKLTSVELAKVNVIGANAFKGAPITKLIISLVGNGSGSIGDHAFEGIKNEASTHVTMPALFSTPAEKDRIFGVGKWDQITFNWTNGYKGTNVPQGQIDRILNFVDGHDNRQRWLIGGQGSHEKFVPTTFALGTATKTTTLEAFKPDWKVDSSNLETLYLPKMTILTDWAFADHFKLKNLYIPEATSIGIKALSNTIISRIDAPKATIIGREAFLQAFDRPGLGSVSAVSTSGNPGLHQIVTKINTHYNNTTYINVPMATTIGDFAFGSVKNDKSTIVIMPIKFNTKAEKNRIFGEGYWNNITFKWIQNGKELSAIEANNIRINGKDDIQKSWFESEFPNAEFLKNGLKTFKSNATNIGDGALNGINNLVINTVDLPKVTTIGERGFHDQKTITSVKLPNVETIGHDAFKFAQITQLDLPKVKTIIVGSFLNSPLTELNIPVLENIDMQGADSSQWAPFKTIVNNPSTTVTMPLALRLKRDDLFGPGNWDKITFKWATDLTKPTVTKTDVEINRKNLLAKETLNTKDGEFANKLFLKDWTSITSTAVKTVKADSFASTKELSIKFTSVTLNNATTIEANAFKDNKELATITLPKVETIGNSAFEGDSKITALNLPEVKTIGDNTFKGNTAITTITLPKVETIGNSAFEGDSKISALDLAKAITIGDNAFKGNTAITTITLPEVDKISANAFEGVTKVTSLDLHTVNTIGANAFKDAPLTSLDISNAGNGVGTIGDHAFESIANGAKVTMPLTFNNDKDLKRIFGDNYKTKNIDFTWVLGYKSSAALSDDEKKAIMQLKDETYKNYTKNDSTLPKPLLPTIDKLTELYLPKLENMPKGIFINSTDNNGSFVPNLTKLVVPNVLNIANHALIGAKKLETLEAPKLISVGNNSIRISENLTELDLPEIKTILLGAFAASKITHLNIPKADNILRGKDHPEYGAFIKIVNEPTTKVTMPIKYNDNYDKDRIFNTNKWDQIKFTWTDFDGNIISKDQDFVNLFKSEFKDEYNISINKTNIPEVTEASNTKLTEDMAKLLGITTKDDKINIKQLLTNELVKITYSHPVINGDGDYNIKLKIEKGSSTETKTIVIHVTDMNKYNVLNTANIQKTLTEGFKVKDFWKALTTLDTDKITSVGDNTFAKSTKVPVVFTSVNLPNATSIGNSAFKDNTALTTIALPKVTNIADNAFKGNTSLAAIKLDEVTNIGASAFEGNTKLTSVELAKVNVIGANAFKGAPITKLIIPDAGNAKGSIGDNAFADIANGANITMPAIFDTNEDKTRIFGSDWDKKNLHFTWTFGYKYSGTLSDADKTKLFTLKDMVNTPSGLFGGSLAAITELGLPKMKVINADYFATGANTQPFPNITKLVLPVATKVGTHNFIDSSKITTFIAPELTSVGDNSVRNAVITKLDLPNVKEIHSAAFKGSKLTYLNIPKADNILRDKDHPEYGAFINIDNKPTTKVIMPIKYNNAYDKDRIFGKDKWSKIDFTWVTWDGSLIKDKTQADQYYELLTKDVINRDFAKTRLSWISSTTTLRLNATFIDEDAFFNDNKITKLYLPNLKEIRFAAFNNSPLTYINAPKLNIIYPPKDMAKAQYAIFYNVVNSPNTIIRLPYVFKTTFSSDIEIRLIGKPRSEWNQIKFIWVKPDGTEVDGNGNPISSNDEPIINNDEPILTSQVIDGTFIDNNLDADQTTDQKDDQIIDQTVEIAYNIYEPKKNK